METLRFRRRVENDTLLLTGLARFVGKEVEIIILVEPDAQSSKATSLTKAQRTPGSAKGLVSLSGDFFNALNGEEGMQF